MANRALGNELNLTGTLHRATVPLSIFRQRNFSLLWTSMTLVGMGNQMEQVVLGWYVLTLTDSPFLVGLVGSARMALNFLALFTGAIADRVPRQRLLAGVEFSMALLGTGMVVLIISDRLEVWHLYAITLLGGVIRLFQMPAAQSMVADTLSEDRISNGAALTNMGRNLTTVIGPLIGGILFQRLGPEGAFMVVGVALFLRRDFRFRHQEHWERPEPGKGVAPPGHFGRIEVHQGSAGALGYSDSGCNHQLHRLATPHHTYAGVRPGCTGNWLDGPRDVDFHLWHWGFAGFNGLGFGAQFETHRDAPVRGGGSVAPEHGGFLGFHFVVPVAGHPSVHRSVLFLDPGFDADPPAQDDPSGVQRAGAGDAFFCHLRLHLREFELRSGGWHLGSALGSKHECHNRDHDGGGSGPCCTQVPSVVTTRSRGPAFGNPAIRGGHRKQFGGSGILETQYPVLPPRESALSPELHRL